MQRTWCIEFWDNDAWNEMANTRSQHKQQCINAANILNRKTPHDIRRDFFGGHRYRVRRVKTS